MINKLKNLLKRSPIALNQNHRYDILTKKIINNLDPDSNGIDVGCYKGEILDLILKAAPQGRHFGIEPVPAQYEILREKYKNLKNCTILNFAASNVSGSSDFNYVISNPAYSGLVKRDYDRAHEKDQSIRVKTELLDQLIDPGLRIDLIKIDVEGAELRVLEGASEIISRWRPLVIFEHGLGASEHYGTTPNMVYDYFEERKMKISNLKRYLKGKGSLSKEEFEKQYYEKENYYFIAHA